MMGRYKKTNGFHKGEVSICNTKMYTRLGHGCHGRAEMDYAASTHVYIVDHAVRQRLPNLEAVVSLPW